MKQFLLLFALISAISLQAQDFITEWNFSNSRNHIYFNALTEGGEVNYTWSASPSGNSGSGSFTQTTPGFVTLSGLNIFADDVVTLSMTPTNLRRFYIDGGTDRFNLTNVTQWGSVPWTSMEKAFKECSNLQISATDVPNLSGVSSMYEMFAYCTTLNSPSNINSWNTATVIDMNSLFRFAYEFNQDIGNWNTSSVTYMSFMFENAASFNQDIGNWNTASVINMAGMFLGNNAFNQDISNWNTETVIYMAGVFSGASSFNQDIGNWTLNASVNMYGLLYGSGMDCDHYSATLVGWEANNPNVTNRLLGASGRFYGTSAIAARDILVNDRGWTINGDMPSGDTCDLLLSNEYIKLDNQVIIYPNPSSKEFKLKFNRTYQHIEIQVFNVRGQVVFNQSFENTDFIELDIYEGSGIYFLKINSDNQLNTYKLIKK